MSDSPRDSRFVGRSGDVAVTTPSDHVPEFNAAGYDLALARRYVYAFVASDRSRVKVGMVGKRSRLKARHREVANAAGDPGLWHATDVSVDDVDAQTIEGIEMSMQTWLALAAGLPFGGAVDWLSIPEDSPVRSYDSDQWDQLLGGALDAVLAWRTIEVDL